MIKLHVKYTLTPNMKRPYFSTPTTEERIEEIHAFNVQNMQDSWKDVWKTYKERGHEIMNARYKENSYLNICACFNIRNALEVQKNVNNAVFLVVNRDEFDQC